MRDCCDGLPKLIARGKATPIVIGVQDIADGRLTEIVVVLGVQVTNAVNAVPVALLIPTACVTKVDAKSLYLRFVLLQRR
jgi:hypothetical protein